MTKKPQPPTGEQDQWWLHSEGSFGLVRHENLGGALIRWYQTVRVLFVCKKEAPTKVDHTFNLKRDGETIVESTPSGTKKARWREKYVGRKGVWGITVCIVGFTEAQHRILDRKSDDYEGRTYGFAAAVKHWADGIASHFVGHDVFVFRRLRLPWKEPSLFYNLCSWLSTFTHKHARWVFAVRAGHSRAKALTDTEFVCFIREKKMPDGLVPLDERRAQPDDLWDDVFGLRPEHYRITNEINSENRPESLNTQELVKIEGDLALGRGRPLQ